MSDRIKNWIDDIRRSEEGAAGIEKAAAAVDAEMDMARAAQCAETAPAVNRRLARALALAAHIKRARGEKP